MKRNMESESGSSDEERTSLKKAKKENFGNGEMSESVNTELIDGSKKRIANSNVKIEAPLPELKDIKGLYTGKPDGQKFVEDKSESDGGHENGSIKEELQNRNEEDIIREMELISKSFIIGRHSKEYSSSGNTEVEDILENICSEEEAAYVNGNMGEDSVSNDKECILLADKLTRLFRSIYYDTRGKICEEETINKCQGRRNIDDNVDMKVTNADKEKSYSSLKEKACSDEEFNNSYDCGETSDINYEPNDGVLGKDVSDYSNDNDIRNERHDASNNSSFRVRNSTNIKSEGCERNVWEESKNICNAVTNDGGLGKEESGDTNYDGVQGDERANKNGVEENDATTETEISADCQSNANSKECRTSDEESDSITDMINGEENRNSSDEEVNYESDNSDLISDGEVGTTSCGIENNSSFESDSTELGDMSTDEEYSWSDESKSSSYAETDSSDKEEFDDESSTDQSIDTSSVEDDSTDDSSGESIDEEYDSSNGSEDNSDWETTDESLGEDTNTSYGEEIDSDVSPLGNDENAYALFSYRNNKEITSSCTEEENSFDCASGRSTPETGKDLGDSENIKNKKTTERCSEVNDENDSAENKSSDDEDLERSFDNVLGFLSNRRFSIGFPGEGTISVCVTSLKLMPLKDCFRESVDGRRKKRAAVRRKDNIKTPSVGGNNRNGKVGMRSRNAIKNKFRVQNKAAEMSDSGELSDEEIEGQVRNNRSIKRKNRKSNKEIEPDDSMDEDDEDEDYDDEKKDEDSSDIDSEDSEGLEDEEEEDYGEEDVGDSEDIEDEEDDEEDEERDVDESEEQDSEDDDGEKNDEDFEENGEENEVEDDIKDVRAQVENEDDSDESSDENDKNERKIKQTKSRIMIKKKGTKERVRGKRNLMKRGVK